MKVLQNVLIGQWITWKLTNINYTWQKKLLRKKDWIYGKIMFQRDLKKNTTAQLLKFLVLILLLLKCKMVKQRKYSSVVSDHLKEKKTSWRSKTADRKDTDNKKKETFRPLYDIPHMFEAREFLRKKLIGKQVKVVVDYVQPARDTLSEKTCCTVNVGRVWV